MEGESEKFKKGKRGCKYGAGIGLQTNKQTNKGGRGTGLFDGLGQEGACLRVVVGIGVLSEIPYKGVRLRCRWGKWVP